MILLYKQIVGDCHEPRTSRNCFRTSNFQMTFTQVIMKYDSEVQCGKLGRYFRISSSANWAI